MSDRSAGPCYPVGLNVANRRCVVVGSGGVAERKVRSLLATGARVVIISPDLAPGLRELHAEGRLEHVARAYRQGDLAQAFLAIAATGDRAINRAVADEARSRNVLANVVDDPARCDFTIPAVLRRGDLLVSVATGGRSPAVARYIRDELERVLTREHVALLEVVAEVRAELQARGQRVSREAWRLAIDDDLLAPIRRGDLDLARSRLAARLTGQTVDKPTKPQ